MLATKCDLEIRPQHTVQDDQGLAGSALIRVSLLQVWQCVYSVDQ